MDRKSHLKRHKRKTFILYGLIISTVIIFISSLFYLSFLIISSPRKLLKEEIVELPRTGEDVYRVFVSSSEHNGSFGTLSQADSLCQSDADTAKLGGRWVAWISSSSEDAKDRVLDTEYYLVDKTTRICTSRADLIDTEIENYMDKNEYGDTVDNFVRAWTGTSSIGEYVSSTYSCSNWQGTGGVGAVGFPKYKIVGWTWFEFQYCHNDMSLYCFEVDKYPRNLDGDDYNEDLDCDDNDSTVYPGATEICDGKDNDCDGVLPSEESDNDKDSYLICSDVYGDCDDADARIYPGASERCNGKDDNCDGKVPNNEKDNDSDGYFPCEGDCKDNDASINPGITEICDVVDNDCDSKIDENLKKECGINVGICTEGEITCVNGKWGPCTSPQAKSEICDGLDNNCDGKTDEGCSCDSGQVQACGSSTGECSIGTQWCEGKKWGECRGNVGASSEICDGKDNDCDGEIDENISKSCGSNIGECKEGVQFCDDGSWGDCTGGIQKSKELCDQVDNDCNGTKDEGCSCQSGDERECGIKEGQCSLGIQKCKEGVWSDCEGAQIPDEEVCDEEDNDCDGEVDEDLLCDQDSEEAEEIVDEERDWGKIAAIAAISVSFITFIPLSIIMFKKYKQWKDRRAIYDFKGEGKRRGKNDTEKSPLA